MGAQREILEETGLTVRDLELRAIVHVAGRYPDPGVIFTVFVGEAPTRDTVRGDEGELVWCPIDDLPLDELVEDLPHLLPLILGPVYGRPIYGYYAADDVGEMSFEFRESLERSG